MDPRPLPPKAFRLTGNICPTCQLPVGMVTYERFDTQVLFCPACENGWTRHEPAHAQERKGGPNGPPLRFGRHD